MPVSVTNNINSSENNLPQKCCYRYLMNERNALGLLGPLTLQVSTGCSCTVFER